LAIFWAGVCVAVVLLFFDAGVVLLSTVGVLCAYAVVIPGALLGTLLASASGGIVRAFAVFEATSAGLVASAIGRPGADFTIHGTGKGVAIF
jgi:hypothetical protein